MKITLSFSRAVAGTEEKMASLIFNEGDFYDIYNHMVMDKDLADKTLMIARQAGFRIKSANNDVVTIEKIAPPLMKEQITLGEKTEFDFGCYGTYTITLISLDSNS